MLSNNFSEVTILVGRNRVANGKNLLKKENIDVMLLDDGFQHWRLHRDLDIVTIDCGNAFGNGRVLPRGILREPVSSLKRANIFVLTKTDLAAEELNIIKQKLKRVNSEALVIESKHKLLYLTEMDKEDKIPVSDLKDRKVVLLCSIADPGSFKKSVVGLGANIKNDFFFLDHHQYLEKEIDNVLEYCSSQGITDIITTEKDAVRLQALGMKDFKGCRVLVLYITLKITENEKGLFDRLHSACNI